MATILLIDDDESFAYATAKLIKQAGHRVITLTDSRRAGTILETVQDIELLVADIVMAPGHPNGFAVANAARARNPGLKVVYMSGHQIDDLAAEERLLLKPFTTQALVFEIEARLREPRAPRR